MAGLNRVTLFAKSSTLAFYPAVASGINVLGQASYLQNIQPWMADQPYYQKVLNTDDIAIMCHMQVAAHRTTTGTAFICDHHKNVIAGINLNVTPYFKGYQFISDNIYTYASGSWMQLRSMLWVFNFNNFISSIPDGGIYYVKIVNTISGEPDIEYYSEPLLVINDIPFTIQMKYAYNTNNASKWIITTGWYNDYPANKQPMLPVFTLRCEGYTQRGFNPKGINIGYLSHKYNQLQIKTNQKRIWMLHIGELSIGIPDYMLEKCCEALTADTLMIDNYAYIIFNPGGQESLTDIMKIQSSNDAAPLIRASLAIMERDDNQQGLVSPPETIYDRIFSEEFSGEFS